MIRLVDEAVAAGARLAPACELIGLPPRTLQRWRQSPEDRRPEATRPQPSNRLSDEERRRVVATANSPEFRDLSPKQIVPLLADRGEYLASESTFYRVLAAEGLTTHRAASRPPVSRAPRERIATGPNEIWSWDITFLPSVIRGRFFQLYLIEDIWSRKIVGWRVHDRESHVLAAELFVDACRNAALDPAGLILHSDNGAAMKGATMLATLHRLGVVPSFNRPRVSDDNPFSEALFRTLKYRPEYPSRPFASIEDARAWVERFVRWYNTAHLHSAISFVTPEQRHTGQDVDILARRRAVYANARAARPNRWPRQTRPWASPGTVVLNRDATSTATRLAA